MDDNNNNNNDQNNNNNNNNNDRENNNNVNNNQQRRRRRERYLQIINDHDDDNNGNNANNNDNNNVNHHRRRHRHHHRNNDDDNNNLEQFNFEQPNNNVWIINGNGNNRMRRMTMAERRRMQQLRQELLDNQSDAESDQSLVTSEFELFAEDFHPTEAPDLLKRIFQNIRLSGFFFIFLMATSYLAVFLPMELPEDAGPWRLPLPALVWELLSHALWFLCASRFTVVSIIASIGYYYHLTYPAFSGPFLRNNNDQQYDARVNSIRRQYYFFCFLPYGLHIAIVLFRNLLVIYHYFDVWGREWSPLFQLILFFVLQLWLFLQYLSTAAYSYHALLSHLEIAEIWSRLRDFMHAEEERFRRA